MGVFLISILFSFFIYIFTSFYLRNRIKALLYSITFILLLTPASLIFGFGNSFILNIHFSYFFILFFLPIVIIRKKEVFWKKGIITSFNNRIGKFLLFILFFKFFLSLSRLYFYNINPFIDFVNSSKEFFFIFILSYFYYATLSYLGDREKEFFIRNTIGFFSIIAAFFGMVVLWDIYPFNYIQEQLYEFKVVSSSGMEISMKESILRDKRSYSFFSAANQFGTFSAIGATIAAIFFKQKKINLYFFLAVITSSLLMVYASQSRTGFLFLIFFLLITIISKNLKSILLLGLFALLSTFFIDLLPNRLLDSFNKESFNSNLENQRLSFWLQFFDKLEFNLDFIFNGFYNSTFLKKNLIFFESGILNFLSKHGLIVFLVFFYLLIKGVFINKIHPVSKNNIIRQSSFWVLTILILGEIFQGWILNYRFETITSLFLALSFSNNNRNK